MARRRQSGSSAATAGAAAIRRSHYRQYGVSNANQILLVIVVTALLFFALLRPRWLVFNADVAAGLWNIVVPSDVAAESAPANSSISVSWRSFCDATKRNFTLPLYVPLAQTCTRTHVPVTLTRDVVPIQCRRRRAADLGPGRDDALPRNRRLRALARDPPDAHGDCDRLCDAHARERAVPPARASEPQSDLLLWLAPGTCALCRRCVSASTPLSLALVRVAYRQKTDALCVLCFLKPCLGPSRSSCGRATTARSTTVTAWRLRSQRQRSRTSSQSQW